MHSEKLTQLAGLAEAATEQGDLVRARDHWSSILRLLPTDSQQSAVSRDRVTELSARIEQGSAPASATGRGDKWWQRGAAGVVTLVAILISKLKCLILGLTKASTFISMFAFFGVYWRLYGWPLALGLVLSIYIHEMGHVSELRRFGVAANAPLFIPGVGALVLLKQRIDDPIIDARIGLAGPLWGLAAGAAAFIISLITRSPTWGAIAELTGFINLFNLIPIWQLDGSRGFHALSNVQRLTIVAASALAFAATGQKLLLLLGLVAAFRAFQASTTADSRAFATFVGLIAALSWLARSVG